MAIPIESLMPNGNSFSQSGKFILTLCPFHPDINPSFWIDVETNTCSCFAGCFARPQTVFGFYSKLHQVSINEAIVELSKIKEI
jgi:DNA primase